MRARSLHAKHSLLLILIVTCSACSWLPLRNEPAAPATPAVTQAPAPEVQHSARQVEDAAATAVAGASGGRDLWRTIGNEMRLAAAPEARIAEPLARAGGAAFIQAASANAVPFLAHVHAEIKRRNLPFEIALVPVIESGYDPAATSPAGAAGIWQFMPATGRRFGLTQTRWYDGRRDLLASTRAALDYFELLRDRFMGDWELVFAAYNCGERTVERAIERNARLGHATNFAALELPSATREYVPKLLSLAEVVADPEAYGVSLASIPDTPHFQSIDVGKALDLNRVIEWSGMDPALFDRLNAGFRKRLTVSGAPSRILLHPPHIPVVRERLAALPDDARDRARVHVVSRGETLSHIAAATAIPVAAIRRANDLTTNRLAIGQELVIPTPRAMQAMTPALPRESAERRHTVVRGDSLWSIARRYDTRVEVLARANGINSKATLAPGQEILVPGTGTDMPGATSPTADYEVRRGDSLWTIARRFNVSVAELRRWNALDKRALLQPGQRLLVHPPAAGAAARGS